MIGALDLGFAQPWVLSFLVVPLLLIFLEVQRRGHRIHLPFDQGQQRRNRWLGAVLVLGCCLPALLLANVILFLAGPTRPGLPSKVRELTNIELCLDVSGSMTSSMDDGQTRYQAAMSAIRAFTEARRGDAFGLTIFGHEVLRWMPLTKDLQAIAHATPFVDPETLPSHFGGTMIGLGLQYCRKTLIKQKEGDRLIILLSDGQSSDLSGDAPAKIAQSLRDDNIVLYSIFIGAGNATEQLHRVTAPTGGEVFAAEDADGLKRVFAHIDKMKPARLKPTNAQPIFDYYWFAVTALSLLGCYLLTLLGLRFNPW